MPGSRHQTPASQARTHIPATMPAAWIWQPSAGRDNVSRHPQPPSLPIALALYWLPSACSILHHLDCLI